MPRPCGPITRHSAKRLHSPCTQVDKDPEPKPTTHYSLLTTPFSRLTTHDSRLTTHHSLLTTHDSLLTTHDSLLTTHYSPLTTHYSPLTTHHSLRRSTEYRSPTFGPMFKGRPVLTEVRPLVADFEPASSDEQETCQVVLSDEYVVLTKLQLGTHLPIKLVLPQQAQGYLLTQLLNSHLLSLRPTGLLPQRAQGLREAEQEDGAGQVVL